ncbi:MAG: hypothetical protein A3I89_03955 [Candidatus Harrisonbacteria bacterium RIFCSPLOWO2_02_FULL_41_11]|nr:MAG: hypothetical protein A3I89_03955 [Candidatus Harrisonbacteria bacterium RIFCSPLOWO2_02_FULL_41_11]
MVVQGKYDLKSNVITGENFPTTRKGEANLILEFVQVSSEAVTYEEVIAGLKKRGFRPAELRELLSFGVQYPKK